MLVSSIGYFDRNLRTKTDVKNRALKANLSEGFGHYNQKTSDYVQTSGVIKTIISSLKSMFFKDKAESLKYTSLTA